LISLPAVLPKVITVNTKNKSSQKIKISVNLEKVTMNKNLGVIMSTKNVNRNSPSTSPSQTITPRGTDLATTMPVASR
jgi:hypothetical protein